MTTMPPNSNQYILAQQPYYHNGPTPTTADFYQTPQPAIHFPQPQAMVPQPIPTAGLATPPFEPQHYAQIMQHPRYDPTPHPTYIQPQYQSPTPPFVAQQQHQQQHITADGRPIIATYHPDQFKPPARILSSQEGTDWSFLGVSWTGVFWPLFLPLWQYMLIHFSVLLVEFRFSDDEKKKPLLGLSYLSVYFPRMMISSKDDAQWITWTNFCLAFCQLSFFFLPSWITELLYLRFWNERISRIFRRFLSCFMTYWLAYLILLEVNFLFCDVRTNCCLSLLSICLFDLFVYASPVRCDYLIPHPHHSFVHSINRSINHNAVYLPTFTSHLLLVSGDRRTLRQ